MFQVGFADTDKHLSLTFPSKFTRSLPGSFLFDAKVTWKLLILKKVFKAVLRGNHSAYLWTEWF